MHLDAIGAYQLHHPTKPGVLFLRQKPDEHGYGPLAFLPRGAGGSVEQLAAPVKAPGRTGGGVHRRGAQEEEEEVEEEGRPALRWPLP